MYTTPGHNPDQLDDTLLKKWNETLSTLFDQQIAVARAEREPAAERAWLYNPITAGGGQFVEGKIDWIGFPKTIKSKHNLPDDAWEASDNNRDLQEEYCEWEVVRNPQGRIVRLTVTCETEDYYRFLAAHAKEKLLSLYHTYVSPDVKMPDLFTAGGDYRPQNKWNYPQKVGVHGVLMHMAQRNNSFAAAVNLSAVASWPRANGVGQLITDEQQLIACRPFGVAGRHSDPHIGAEINSFVRNGKEISFADPVGLYIHSINTQGWEFPDRKDPKEWFKIKRGTEAFMLRVVFEAPPESGFILADVKIAGVGIEFGGQIIDRLKVRITGIARQAAQPAPSLQCEPAATQPQIMMAGNAALFSAPKPSRLTAGVSVMSDE